MFLSYSISSDIFPYCNSWESWYSPDSLRFPLCGIAKELICQPGQHGFRRQAVFPILPSNSARVNHWDFSGESSRRYELSYVPNVRQVVHISMDYKASVRCDAPFPRCRSSTTFSYVCRRDGLRACCFCPDRLARQDLHERPSSRPRT